MRSPDLFHIRLRGCQQHAQRAVPLAFVAEPTGDLHVRNPRDFGKPLAIGAPAPTLEIPFKPSRMIHFFDPGNEKMAAKLPELAAKSDILLGNLEDAVPVDRKLPARAGLVRIGK